jgi:hypothetical protein
MASTGLSMDLGVDLDSSISAVARASAHADVGCSVIRSLSSELREGVCWVKSSVNVERRWSYWASCRQTVFF